MPLIESLISFRVRVELELDSEPISNAAGALVEDFIDFCSFVFRWKWEIGAGDTWKSPDPNRMSYPRSSKEWRLEWDWSTAFLADIEPQISKELGLRYHLTVWSSNSAESEEDYHERMRDYFESGDEARDRRVIHNEMERRGITFEGFVEHHAASFPERGKYNTLLQLAEDSLEAPEVLSPPDYRMQLSFLVSRVWKEYYGYRTLSEEFEFEIGRRLARLGRRLASSHFSAEPKLVSYRLLETIERTIHRIVRERLQRQYGPEETGWWVKGVPEDLRKELAARRESDPDREEVWNYVDLIDLSKVIEKNWALFEDIFGSPVWGGKQRKSRLSAFGELNQLRKRVAHSVRRGITQDEYRFLMSLERSLPLGE